MEKTLVINPPEPAAPMPAAPMPAAPMPAAPMPAAPVPPAPIQAAPVEAAPKSAEPAAFAEADPTSTGGFSSARDAIAKLMGDAPSAATSTGERHLLGRNPMDMEATLTALDATLAGGQPAPPPGPDHTASTTKLTAQEIQAAMASVTTLPRAMASAPPQAPRAEVPPPPKPMEPPTAPGADLLKIQMETETLNNVTIDQVTTWIEQGRVHEYHMVARQYSDNWIEAVKVPALRPVFERKRRDGAPSSEVPFTAEPVRRSLFGGLFGRN
jgi:hypothetical protein